MDIHSLKEEHFTGSKYIKPRHFVYSKNGKTHSWDFIEVMDSVSVLLYHTQKDSFVFVRQFRIPLWDYQKRNEKILEEKKLGYSIELCSGLVDKNLSLEDIAREECVEELGYLPKQIEIIGNFYAGFGSGVSKQTLFYAEVDENVKISQGGGIDDEEIEAVLVKVADFEEFTKAVAHSVSLDYAYLWYLRNKAQNRALF